MGTIGVFNFASVDGYFSGPNGEIEWFKFIDKDKEFDEFTHKQSKSGSTLLFGHTTYEMMKSYWPTPDAMRNDPDMAGVMNNAEKIVFSKKLQSAKEKPNPNWKNVKIMHEINPEEIIRLKKDKDIIILGSGTIVAQLSNMKLIDEYTFVVVPLTLGAGKSMFKDVKMNLKLLEAKKFKNGLVILRYKPA